MCRLISDPPCAPIPPCGGSWAALDLRLNRRILRDVTLSIEASNALDRELSELHGVPLPGRWLSVTVRYREEAR